jgi:AAA family ATP:ADP antiporter
VSRLSLPRFVDLRAGEGPAFALAFALFGLTIGGHTLVETARDTLFLTRLPPERLAYVYVSVAVGTLVVTPLWGRLVEWIGARSALVATLLLYAFGVAWFRVQAPTASSVFGLYVFGGLLVTLLVAQFWMLVSSLFTAAQGRRLFGPLAASGVLGAVVGAFGSALLVRTENVQRLLSSAAMAFVLAAFVATFIELDDDTTPSAGSVPGIAESGLPSALPRRWPREPLVWKVALIVALSTALSVVVDYVFKLRAVRALAPSELGSFFARYYLAGSACGGCRCLRPGRSFSAPASRR